MKPSTIFIIILIAGLSISLYFLFSGQQFTRIQDNQIEALKFQRDSILNSSITASKEKESSYKQVVDSLVRYSRTYTKADSLNKIHLYNEQKKIRLLTRAGRDKVRDSLFLSNSIH